MASSTDISSSVPGKVSSGHSRHPCHKRRRWPNRAPAGLIIAIAGDEDALESKVTASLEAGGQHPGGVALAPFVGSD